MWKSYIGANRPTLGHTLTGFYIWALTITLHTQVVHIKSLHVGMCSGVNSHPFIGVNPYTWGMCTKDARWFTVDYTATNTLEVFYIFGVGLL